MQPASVATMINYPFTRILVPTDFSTCSDTALALGARLAHEHQAELLVLHIVETHGLPRGTVIHPVSNPEGITIERYAHDMAMRELTVRLAHLPVPARHRRRVVAGSPAATIIEIAEAESADLIVMGTRGRTGLAHMLVGSVAEKVVRHSAIPVLTVREPTCRQQPLDPALDGERDG